MPRRVTTIDLDAEPSSSTPRRDPGPLIQLLLNPQPSPDLDQLLRALQGAVYVSVIRPGESEAQRVHLGISSEALMISVSIWDPLRWYGYYFSALGTYAPTTVGVDTAPILTLRVYNHEETD